MTIAQIDNTDAGTIERTILWQYEGAPKLVAMILSWKDFFNGSTTDLHDRLLEELDLTDENISDYGLSVWGRILGVVRPLLTYVLDGAAVETTQVMTRELYRKILLGRLRLSERDATIPAYLDYVKFVFGNNIQVVDDLDMGMTFFENGELTNEELAAVEQHPDVVFMLPAGVRSNDHSASAMFGLDGQQNEPSVVNVGGLDESGFNWRLTPKGNWQ